MRHSPDLPRQDSTIDANRMSFSRRIAQVMGGVAIETAGVTGIAINVGIRATGALAKGIITGS